MKEHSILGAAERKNCRKRYFLYIDHVEQLESKKAKTKEFKKKKQKNIEHCPGLNL